jgi:hypothetical protein
LSSEAEVERPRVPPALVALVAPDTGMDLQARVGRARFAFLAAMVCALLAAFAHTYRVDSRDGTLKDLEKSGQLENMSDKSVDDEVTKANRLYQVSRVAWGGFEAPLFLGLNCLTVLGLVWFARGKVKGKAVVPVAAAALLPGAVADLVEAVAAWQHATLPPRFGSIAMRDVASLATLLGHPLSLPWSKIGFSLDFFSLWSAILMAWGVSAAGDVPPRRALVVTLAGWVCWRLLMGVAFGG